MQSRWKLFRRRARRLSQIGPHQHRLLIEATLALVRARLELALVPFPRLARRMGGFVAPQQARATAAGALPGVDDAAVAREIGWAVTSAARHAPFAAVCLPQAMAAHSMLRKRGIFSVLHFGTARGEALTLNAHAWLDVGAVEVTGYPIGPEFTEVACLVG